MGDFGVNLLNQSFSEWLIFELFAFVPVTG